MRRLSLIALAFVGCSSNPVAGPDPTGSGSGSGSGSDPPPDATTFVDDPGLDGAPFSFSDAACVSTADRITCQDIVYSVVGGTSLHLDVIAPQAATAGPVPTIVYLHPGGWSVGSYHQLSQLQLPTYLARGYAVVSVEYRLTLAPDHSVSGVVFPDNLEDVKTAVRWLRIKGAGFVDPDRILVYGVSAGAHLGALVATTPAVPAFDGRGDPSVSTAVRAFVGLSTPIAFHWFVPENPPLDASCPSQPPGQDPQQGVSWLLGGDLDDPMYTDELAALSPTTYFGATTPPMLLFAGTCDQTVPYQETVEAGNDAKALGLSQIQTVIVPNAFHGTTLDTPASQAAADAFIAAQLGAP
jgi:acetyl esterase/lipase